jgi:putative PEP-CTERM system integral membrane protein
VGKQVTALFRKLFRVRVWGYGLFWSWNIIFLAFMFLGFAPYMLPEVLNAVRSSTIPMAYLVYVVILTLIPALAMILGATILRRLPGALLMLGHGVEGPVMLALGVRLFLIRDANLAVTLLLTVGGLGVAALLWQILDRHIDERGAALTHVRLIGLTLLLAIGLYAGTWVGFYAVPLGSEGIKAIGQLVSHLPEIVRGLWDALRTLTWAALPAAAFSVLGFILLIYTATLLVGLPIAAPVLCIRAWWRGMRALAARSNLARAMTLTATILVACVMVFVAGNQQPQHQAFALLKTPPATPAEAQALLSQQGTLRAGLLNAYLAPFRYLSTSKGVGHVSQMYEYSLKLLPEQAAQVERVYESVARPLLYEPVHSYSTGAWDDRAFREEPVEAANLYKAVFDRPINAGERDTVVRAVRQTWSFSQAEAAWQAVDDREIHLVRQEVSVAEHGDWAEVELYEVYQNKTTQRQEVVYYFSLPESAVITGLWLGNSPDRAERYAYQVAPRGAAQAVYRNELRLNRDPALVEQIGPRQYRLRVFPIEPLRQKWNRDTQRSYVEEGPPLYMWLTLRVMARDNVWPLPRLAERRNVYWDAATVRLVNNSPMQVGADIWLPASAPAGTPIRPAAHRVDFPTGETIIARPVVPSDLPRPASGLQLAIVLDCSYSMSPHAADVQSALKRLAQAAGGASDAYLTASKYHGQAPSRVSLERLDASHLMYAGGQNAAELLTQFNSLSEGKTYDAIFVITDGSGYELGDSGLKVTTPNAPLWMVHLGGEFPLGYDDGTLEAIQASGGGAASNVDEALQRLAAARDRINNVASNVTSDVIDGYVWSAMPTRDADASLAASDEFAPFGARWVILDAMQRQRGRLDQLETLDQLHAIAVRQSVVTPYSSMLVLVDQRQQNLLDTLGELADRFECETEEVGPTAPQNPFAVTGVPEPEEWLLLVLAAGMMGWFIRTRRASPVTR